MKALGLLSLVLALGIAAWLTVKQQDAGEPNRKAAEVAVQKANRVQAKAALATVSSAIRLFKAQVGRLPVDLNELESEGFLDRVPQGLDYDPDSGNITLSED